MPFQNSKNPIPISQIQRIFYLNLINYKKKRIPLCKSILLQNLQWTSFTRYEKIMEFIWVRRWRDRLTSSLSTIFLMIYILNIISRKPSTFNLCIFKYHWILSQDNKSNSYFPIFFINFFKIILKPF